MGAHNRKIIIMKQRVLTILFAIYMLTQGALAQSIIMRSNDDRLFQDFSWLPYAFFSESFGLGVGVGMGYTGWPEEPSSVLGAITLGTKGSYNFIGAITDLRVPGTRRFYMNPLFVFGRYQDQFIYAGKSNPGFEGERAGANDSDPDNFLEATQWDNRIELETRYLLPIGHGRGDENIINRYVVSGGVLESGASGGTDWNPLKSGRTHLVVTPGWREQTLENDDIEVPLKTINVEVGIERDNRDFPFNPSAGSYQKIMYKKDFHDDEQLGGWDVWAVQWSKVFDLGQTGHFRQQTLAFDFTTAYVPSWETGIVDGSEVITKRPPQYEGARLGGIDKMRAYEDNRFHDKAAIYYSAEYRVIPYWQPLKGVDFLEFANISYWQWVLFFEAGQVSPHWNVSDLHDDLHFDGGVSLRGMLHTAVVRLDFAFGEEGGRVIAMYGHPY